MRRRDRNGQWPLLTNLCNMRLQQPNRLKSPPMQQPATPQPSVRTSSTRRTAAWWCTAPTPAASQETSAPAAALAAVAAAPPVRAPAAATPTSRRRETRRLCRCWCGKCATRRPGALGTRCCGTIGLRGGTAMRGRPVDPTRRLGDAGGWVGRSRDAFSCVGGVFVCSLFDGVLSARCLSSPLYFTSRAFAFYAVPVFTLCQSCRLACFGSTIERSNSLPRQPTAISCLADSALLFLYSCVCLCLSNPL